MKIGVFDSGLGGLVILRSILKKLSDYDYCYLGDNAHVPYGGRSQDLIYQFTQKAVTFLFNKECKLVILACNTASSLALRRLQQEFLPKYYPDRKILGVIIPISETVVDNGCKRVGVIGTYATVYSKAFEQEIHKLNPRISIFQNPSPLLVPIIEEGKYDWKGLDLVLDEYLEPLLKEKIDSLVLGCTHYGLILDSIKKRIGSNINVFSEGEIVADKLYYYLKKHPEIEKDLSKNNLRNFYVTDLCQRYKDLLHHFIDDKTCIDKNLELVELDNQNAN